MCHFLATLDGPQIAVRCHALHTLLVQGSALTNHDRMLQKMSPGVSLRLIMNFGTPAAARAAFAFQTVPKSQQVGILHIVVR